MFLGFLVFFSFYTTIGNRGGFRNYRAVRNDFFGCFRLLLFLLNYC